MRGGCVGGNGSDGLVAWWRFGNVVTMVQTVSVAAEVVLVVAWWR
jgi:hypothetical protein